MKIAATDFQEVEQIAALLLRIEANDARFSEEVLDEIYRYQPFMLSSMLGYKFDLPSEAFDEILKLYVLTWMHFRDQPAAKKKAITQSQFENLQARNIQLLKYLDGENPGDTSFTSVIENDLDRLRSKALWTACMFRFNEQPALNSLDSQTRGITLIGLKSMIECFEENIGN